MVNAIFDCEDPIAPPPAGYKAEEERRRKRRVVEMAQQPGEHLVRRIKVADGKLRGRKEGKMAI